jgi:hypothetical protein
MRPKPLPQETDSLLVLAETAATMLSEKLEYLGMEGANALALLQGSIKAATGSINSYVALIAGSKDYLAVQRYGARARAQCNEALEQLRRRLSRACRLIGDKELLGIPVHGLGTSCGSPRSGCSCCRSPFDATRSFGGTA